MTDDIFEKGKQSKKIFTKVSDDLCLVTKRMPVDDEHLEEYINGIKEARKDGINIAEIIDYKLIDGTTSSYDEDRVHYTKGVFLERLAKGKSNDFASVDISTKEDDSISEKVKLYFKLLEDYVIKMEERAAMPQELIDKFVVDCLRLQDFGLMIDPKPSNFFLNNTDGVTIIDVIPNNRPEKRLEDYDFFPHYIFLAFLGYGRPNLYINRNEYSVITQQLKSRLVFAYSQIDSKCSIALRKAGIKAELVRQNLNKFVDKYVFNKVISGDVMSYLIDCYFEEMDNVTKEDKSVEVSNNTITITI